MPDEGGGDRDGSLREFLSEAEEILDRLSDHLRELETVFVAGRSCLEVVNTIFRETHSLKGFAGLLGFPDIASLSHELEDLLSRLRLGGALDRTVLDLLSDTVDALFEALRGLRSRAPARGDLGALRERLRRAAALDPPTDAGLDRLDLPPALRAALTEFEEVRLGEAHRNGRRLALVRVQTNAQHLDTLLDDAQRRMKAIGELIATLPAPAPSDGVLALDLLVASQGPLSLEGWPPGLVHGVRHVTTLERNAAAPGRDPVGGPEGDLEDLGPPSGLLRVPVARLDEILARAGDLSRAIASLQGGVRSVREQHADDLKVRQLEPLLQAILKRLGSLQRGVIDARLVALDQVFRKIGRVVARVARAVGKEADLHTLGADTEIDKSVMDALAPSLLHLTTNALDHGIESPDERERAGKRRRGRVVLSAFRRGPSVVIDIVDDGRGIGLGTTRAAAEARGLLRPGQTITQEEAEELIFQPGFSTATRVSEVSGRGVGLDVVRRSLRRLKGSIEVRSLEGQGTTFTLTVPISLSLVPALIVRSTGRRFAIPVSSIKENLRLEVPRLRLTAEGEVYDHPDGPLRLFRLDRLLAAPEARDRDGSARYAIVAGSGARRAGIIVDDFVGNQEVVVKPLGRWLRDSPGVAGATDLGDAGVALVLDPEALVAGASDGHVVP